MFPPPETIRGMGTSFQHNDFWDHLSGQALVRKRFSNQFIPEIVALKTSTNSPYSFWGG